MRISDWSSDVCSSDLGRACGGEFAVETRHQRPRPRRSAQFVADAQHVAPGVVERHRKAELDHPDAHRPQLPVEPRVAAIAAHDDRRPRGDDVLELRAQPLDPVRSEEHTSELQSLMRISYAVFCLKKKNKT